MKRLLLLAAFLLWPWTVRAQDSDTLVVDTFTIQEWKDSLRWVGDSLKPTDSVLALCKERGHIREVRRDTTLLYWGVPIEAVIDLPDRTIVIITDPHPQWWRCKRCGTTGAYGPDTTVIWQKPDTLKLRGYGNQTMPFWDSLDANR